MNDDLDLDQLKARVAELETEVGRAGCVSLDWAEGLSEAKTKQVKRLRARLAEFETFKARADDAERALGKLAKQLEAKTTQVAELRAEMREIYDHSAVVPDSSCLIMAIAKLHMEPPE